MPKSGPDKKLCGAKKAKNKGLCGNRAGQGTDHLDYGRCKWHGGSSPSGEQSAEKERINETLASGLVRKRVVDPVTMMLEECYRCAGIVQFLEDIIQMARDDQLTEHTIGGEQLSMWIRQWEKERLTGLHAAAVAAKAGVAERQVRLAEDQGRLMYKAVTAMLNDPRFKITQEQRNIWPELAGIHFGPLTSTGSTAIDVGSTEHGE